MGVVLITSLTVLALTCLGLFGYELHRYRKATAQSLQTISLIIAENSGAVLIFDDQKLATEILNGLRVEPEISAAALFDQHGRLFATYLQDPKFVIPEKPGMAGVGIHARDITIFQPVVQGDAQVGTLYLRGNLQGTYQRLSVYALVLLGVIAAAGAVAFPLSSFLQRRISEPLATLGKVARSVSRDRDYSVRATQSSDDEFGDLTDAFNTMLKEIEVSNAALLEGEERFRTLADNIAQLAWMADGEGTFKWFNKRWYDFTGSDPHTLPTTFENYIHPDHVERVRAKHDDCFAAGQTWEDTFPLRGAEGQYRWFLSHAVPIRDHSGRVLRWFGTSTDVTELRDAQQELKKARDEALAASGAKDDFLAKLSHELRTPLNPVLLLVSDTHRAAHFPKEIRDDFELIRKNVELEARLIDDLLDLTSITRGKLVLARQSVSVNAVVRDALATVDSEILSRQVQRSLRFDPADPHVFGDPVRLQQVFWNLLKNAAKFSTPGSLVSITTSTLPTGDVRVEISDQGIGMAPAEIDRVFEAFVQGDHATPGGSHRFGGLGLGLAISRMLVELHQGRISVMSEGPGKGTTFTVEFPTIPAESPVSPATTASPDRIATTGPTRALIRTLIVEDHEPTRTTLERLLGRRGYQTITAGTVAEARAAAREPIDLLISDIGLPDGTGYTLMKELRESHRLEGIAITGYGMESDVEMAQNAGFLAHLTKPVRVQELDNALAVARHRLAKSDRTGA
jgi:PAS domain S-box-containing protein